MCTLTLAWQVFENAPVVLASNRDERLDRPSEPPQRRDWAASVVAPKDTESGGTWLGYNEHGLLVTITNRWSDRSVTGDRSRGLLVRDALAHESAAAAVRFLERELAARTYEGCHLLVTDRRAALLVTFDGQLRVRTLEPGVHVVVNVGADGRYDVPESEETMGKQQVERAEAIRHTLRPEPGEDRDSWLRRAGEVLRDHEYGTCVHVEGFGTRSSARLSLGGEGPRYEHADGPPCETGYEPVSASLPSFR